MSISVGTYSKLPDTLFETLFSDRRRQFITRHKWDLCVTPEGYEIDEYDREGTEYLVVHENNRHLTSCRLRPVTLSTMLIDHFTDAFPAAENFLRSQSGRLYELTRFLRAPSLSVREGIRAQLAFAKALDQFRDEREAVGFIGVVYPGVSRYLRQSGVRFLVVGVSTIGGRRVELICITQSVPAKRLLVRQHANALNLPCPRPMVCSTLPEEQRLAA